jgi:hypothetical protein
MVADVVQPLLHAMAVTCGIVGTDDGTGPSQDDEVSPVAGSPKGVSADPAARALENLVTELDACIAELQRARTRSQNLLEKRRSGRPWLEVVTGEARPLVVESLSTVLGSLATAGHAWRREQASALQAEDVSINRIAALFGVTRQRISALLRERDAHERSIGEPPA